MKHGSRGQRTADNEDSPMSGASNKPVTSLDDLPLFLTVEQTAAVLGIGRNTTYDMVRSGRIKSVRLGRQIRIPKSSLNSI